MYKDYENITYHECPRCHKQHLSVNSVVCDKCLKKASEQEDINVDEDILEGYEEYYSCHRDK